MLRIKYGKELKDEMFNLDKSIKFTNHGSYGSVPKSILEKKFQLQIELEKSPDKWFRFTSYDMYKKNIESLARYLRVNEENLVFTENATDGINCALKSIEFDGCGDAILATNYTYPAILNTIDYISKYRFKQEFDQVNVVKAQMRYPIKSVESLLNEFDEKCREIVVEKKQRLRLAVIDHISSATAMLFPIEEIIKLIRKWNKDCIVLIDGAHAIGHVNLDLTKLDCEFYVSNLHKWFLAPRGCSFLYFKNLSDLSANLSDKICVLQPNYISHGYAKSVQFNFYSRGTKDATSWFLVNECIQFYENYLGGLNNIQNYCCNLLEEAVEMLRSSWKTNSIEMPKELEAPFMKLIKLPPLKTEFKVESSQEAEKVSTKIMKTLFDDFGIICCVVYIQNELYVRISCFPYNCIEDYEALKDAILRLI